MVSQLLVASRLEAGVLTPQVEVFAVPPLVERTWAALRADRPFELSVNGPAHLAVADPDRLEQVLWALLDNAVKYGRGTRIAVEIAADARNALLRLTVSDGGPGIAEADRSRLFGRFARGNTTSDDGSGLGLYVSRELCRAMDGDLVLEPVVPGRGAAFSVYLPAELPEEI
jgi:signal transduction histidine kinase